MMKSNTLQECFPEKLEAMQTCQMTILRTIALMGLTTMIIPAHTMTTVIVMTEFTIELSKNFQSGIPVLKETETWKLRVRKH